MGNNLQQCICFQEPQGITCDLTSATTEKNISKLMNENSQALVIMKKKNLEECLMDLSKEDLIQKIQELKEESKNTPKFINKTPLSDLLRADKAEDKEKLKRKKKLDDFMSWSKSARSIAKQEILNMEIKIKKLGSELDICFCIDATGSMSGLINSVKQCIVQVSSRLSSATGMKSRYSLVVYRDYCDGILRHQVWDFTDSSTLSYYLQTVAATGGGDGPEDCFGGLRKAINNVSWSSPSKIIIWMGDSPQHGTNYNGGWADDYPYGDPEGVTSNILFEELLKNKIILVFCKLTDSTDAMINKLKQEIVPYGEGLFLQYNFGGDMESFLTKTVTATTARTTSFGEFDALKVRKPFILTPATWVIDMRWNIEESCSIFTFEAYNGGDFNPLLDILLDGPGVDEKKATIQITINPVEEGEMRFAFFAMVKLPGKLSWTNNRKKGIVKESRYQGTSNSKENLEKQAHIQAIALYLADRFNEKLDEYKIDSKKIIYVPVELLKIPSRPEGKKFYTLEPFIDGNYLKFNNNNGFVNKEQEAFHPILQTFTHFTYCYSNGLVMVTDIQGVIGKDSYKLTDPAIHTADNNGMLKDSTNLGTKGISAFFATHHCNSFCNKLALKLPSEMDENADIDMPKFKPSELVPIDEDRWEECDD